MTKPWKLATALLACSCLSGSACAQLVPDSTRLQRSSGGQAFPFQVGVAMDLELYRSLRQQATLSELLLASKEARLRALTEQLATSQQLYASCSAARQATEAASARKDTVIDTLAGRSQRLPRAAACPPRLPGLMISASAALATGLLIGLLVSPR